jgi:hypothetical protein
MCIARWRKYCHVSNTTLYFFQVRLGCDSEKQKKKKERKDKGVRGWEREFFDIHGDEYLCGRDEPPVKDVREPREGGGVGECAEGGREGAGDSAHPGGVVHALRGLGDPEDGEDGLEGLLDEDGAEDLGP